MRMSSLRIKEPLEVHMNLNHVPSLQRPTLSSFENVSDAARFFPLPAAFKLESGSVLRQGRLAFETWGRLNAARDNAILVFSGMSVGSHLTASQHDTTPGWWGSAIGPGKPIDTERFFVICTSMLGSCMGSSGPASLDPVTAQRVGPDFPELTTMDQAKAVLPLLHSLRLTELASVIGLSMGGSLAKSFTACFDGRIQSLVLVSSALEPSAHAILWRQMQMEYVQGDPNWHAGRYTAEIWPREGMLAARRLGLSTYTGAENLDGLRGDLDRFVARKSASFVDAFDPLTFVRLAALQNTLGFEGRSVAGIDHVQVIGASSDILYPPYQQRAVAQCFLRKCNHVELRILHSGNGHDMFLREQERVAAYVAKGLREVETKNGTERSDAGRHHYVLPDLPISGTRHADAPGVQSELENQTT